MTESFLCDDFGLETPIARRLYHEYAATQPIYDYHCHLPPADLAADKQWQNLTQIWLYGDHYKWRAMRTNGVDERFCTGDASDYDKFAQWAATVPDAVGNPLFVWTHLELRRYFGVTDLLNPDSARRIYDACAEQLQTPEFSARNILRRMQVRIVCTTDDPVDDLAAHRQLREEGYEVKVLPTWRPDKGMATENPAALNAWIDQLAAAADVDIKDYASYLDALRRRHTFFHEQGCRLSDHGLETAYGEPFTEADATEIFARLRAGRDITGEQALKFKSAMLYEFGVMDHERGWVQQFHFGAIRNNSTRLFKQLGADTGFDSIGDFTLARPLSQVLDRLDCENKLAKTILYILNPRDNELIATMLGNFQDGSAPGKLQFGSGWWFNDQRDGMERQLTALANMGLLSRFVGMLTDSRSFMSYPRHEYFRRIVCNFLGQLVAMSEVPEDVALLGPMVSNIAYGNARRYFPIEVD